MAKKNKHKKSPAVVQTKPIVEVKKEEAITKEMVEKSSSQEEFEKNKEKLMSEMMDDITELEKTKEDAEKEVASVKATLEDLNKEKISLENEKKQLESEIKSTKEIASELKTEMESFKDDIKDIQDKADLYYKDKVAEADAYAETTRKNADQEYMNRMTEAATNASEIWKDKIKSIENQIKDIAERESAIAAMKRELDRQKDDLEFEKEAIEDTKLFLEKRKTRYDEANPQKVLVLAAELEDEKNKYETLREKYQEQVKKLNEIQVFMDTIKTEVQDSENGKYVASLNDILSSLHELRDKYDKLVSVYERYPDSNSINVLEEKAMHSDKLEAQIVQITSERDKYREEVVAAKNATRELEVIRQEVEATNALNDHLLRELESHKTALESRTGDTCPALSKVDVETSTSDYIDGINARKAKASVNSLQEIVSHVKNYAGSREKGAQLFYSDNDIRAFLAGMAVSRLIILQGMSGTGKSSLPRIFSEAISGFNKLVPVESSWRDRNELLGYYNDFNKKFNAKTFTIELYKSSKEINKDIPTFIVLDEMNLARIEYYFSDFLAILQEPNHDNWLIELVSSDMRTLPMELPRDVKEKMRKKDSSIFAIWEKIEKSRQGDFKVQVTEEEKEKVTEYLEKLGQLTGAKDLINGRKIKVTDNVWFIGTANRDESTFEISDKVYDRAQVVSLNKKAVNENNYALTSQKFISVDSLIGLFEAAATNNKHERTIKNRLDDIDKVLMEKFNTSFGNRIVTQTIDFVAVFMAAGGSLDDALDYQISTKIIRKVISSDDLDALYSLEEVTKNYKETRKMIEKRMNELG